MSTTFHKPPPRRYRLGDLRITNDTAVQWASRLTGRELHPVMNRPTVKKVIFNKIIASARINLEKSLVFIGCLSPKAHHSTDIRTWIHLRFRSLRRVRRMHLHKGCLKRRARRIIISNCSALKQSSDMLGIKEYEFATVLD
jgi:hypothetical protein